MKSTSKIMFVAALALAMGATFSTVRAETSVSYQYPVEKQIDARQIHATHSLKGCAGMLMAEETKLDVVVNFAPNSDKLSGKAVHEVAKAAALIKKHLSSTVHVVVEGYTDSSGKAAHNQDLSYRRAVNVASELNKKFGVPAQVTVAKGFGDTHPIATNSTAVGRAANRRVEFVIIAK